MVATQSFSISRRTLDVEDYIDILRRHAGWIVGPAFLGLVASICTAFMMPNQYTSRATMEIQPAQISEAMVQSTISNSLNERIQQMETQILSRTSLSQIIQDPRNDLYKDERGTQPLEDVIEKMKSAVNIQFVTLPGALGRRASAFNIEFSYKDRYKAQQTVQSLMNKFDEANQNTQKTDQDAVTGLVGDMLEHAKADLQDASDKLTAFKEGNAGKLPNQVELQIAREGADTEKIRSAREQIFRDTQAVDALETQKNQAKGQVDFYDQEQTQLEAMQKPAGVVAQQNQELAKLDSYIDAAEFNLQQLRKQFSEKYPVIKSAQMQLDGYKARREDLAKKIQAKDDADAAKAAEDSAKPKPTNTMAAMREQEMLHKLADTLTSIDLQEKHFQEDMARATTEMETYKKDSDEIQQMLKDSTGIEGQFEELAHNKQLAEDHYLDLEKKQYLASANSQLIQRKAGEVLDVLDTASLPVAPTKPNRYFIVGSGFAMSVILGLGMAGLQEAKDTSLKNLKDVRAYTNLPVLCSIPLLENTMLVKRKRRLTYLAWAAAVLVGAAAVSGAVVYYETITIKG